MLSIRVVSSVTRWLYYYYSFLAVDIHTKKMPKSIKIAQIGSKVWQICIQKLQIATVYIETLPKWWNLATSGHTGIGRVRLMIWPTDRINGLNGFDAVSPLRANDHVIVCEEELVTTVGRLITIQSIGNCNCVDKGSFAESLTHIVRW